MLRDKGWDLEAGQPLHMAARATLLRHCANLPCLRAPCAAACTGRAGARETIEYILPYAGVTMEGEVQDGRATFSLDLGRLLQFLMGLEKITDTLIDPMDRIARVMGAVPPGTGLRSTAERG